MVFGFTLKLYLKDGSRETKSSCEPLGCRKGRDRQSRSVGRSIDFASLLDSIQNAGKVGRFQF